MEMVSVAAPVPGCESCAYNSGERHAPGGRVYENEHWLVEHVGSPWVTGTMVVKTKVHREALWELTPDEAGSLGPTLQAVSQALVAALDAERVWLLMMVDGSPPYHVHMLLLPRYPEGELPAKTAAALADAQHLVEQATDLLDQVDTEALSVRARMVLLQGDLDLAQAAQAASKVRDYIAAHERPLPVAGIQTPGTAASSPVLDSRFRGNDREGAADG